MSSSPADIGLAIQAAQLLDPRLKASERRGRISQLAQRLGVSDSTVYRHIERVESGKPPRKTRADAGASRALPDDVVAAARALFIRKGADLLSTALIGEQLRHQFPDTVITDSALRRLRQTTLNERERWQKAYTTIDVAHANDEWQIDSSKSDFFCLAPHHDKPVRVQLTVCLDACTRSIMYARYATETPYTEVATVLYQAIRRQSDAWPQAGVPVRLTVDWGKVYMSANLEAALGNLGIERNDSHPYYPQDKGKIERAIGTLHHMFEPTLPGYCGNDNKGEHRVTVDDDFRCLAPRTDGKRSAAARAGTWLDKRNNQPLLTLAQANDLLWEWIAGTYNHHTIRTTGMTPVQSWLAHPPVANRTYSTDVLETAVLSRKYPTVHAGKIRCLNCEYYAPELVGCNNTQVEIRYDPADIREIRVYGQTRHLLNGKVVARPWGLICTAKLDNPLLSGSPQAEAELRARKQANAQADAERREWEQSILANPAAAADLTARLAAAAAAAPGIAAPPPDIVPPPAIPGLSHEAEAALENITIGGVPLIRRAATT
jgi:putative transposase